MNLAEYRVELSRIPDDFQVRSLHLTEQAASY